MALILNSDTFNTGLDFTTNNAVNIVRATFDDSAGNTTPYLFRFNATGARLIFEEFGSLISTNSDEALQIDQALDVTIMQGSSVQSLGGYAISVANVALTLVNFGLVKANGIAIRGSGTGSLVINHGDIWSTGNHAFSADVNSSSTVENYGTIRAGSFSVSALDLGNGIDTVSNYGELLGKTKLYAGVDSIFNSGTMRGDTTIEGGGGDKKVLNTGLIRSTSNFNGAIDLTGGLGHDTIINHGVIIGDILLGDGTDIYSAWDAARMAGAVLGGNGIDQLHGNDFIDVFNGGADKDYLFGYGGDDSLSGGAGADEMVGGYGDDTYYVDDAGDVITELVGQGTDIINLSGTTYTLAAGVSVETIFNDSNLGVTITGNELVQTITGDNGGNDVLSGGGNGDTLIGLAGDDTYALGNFTATIVDSAGGNDLVTSTISRSLAAFTTIERLFLVGGFAISGTGNGLANTILGNAAANLIDGGALGDTMRGGGGNDIYVVDSTLDTVDEQNNVGSGTADLVRSSVNFSLVASARVLGIVENLTLTGAAFSGLGNASANIITGNTIANVLSGGGNSDTLAGGLGSDSLTGGAGSDFFVFNTAPHSAVNRDAIVDFHNLAGDNDTIRMENAVFTKLGAAGALNPLFFKAAPAATDANDYIVYNRATGALFYDFNGNAAGGAIQFATIANRAALTASDFAVI